MPLKYEEFQDNPGILETLTNIQLKIEAHSVPDSKLQQDLLEILERKDMEDINKLASIIHRMSKADKDQIYSNQLILQINKELKSLYSWDKGIKEAVENEVAELRKVSPHPVRQKSPLPEFKHNWLDVVKNMLNITRDYESYLSTEKSTPLKERSLFNKVFSSYVERKSKQYEGEKQSIYEFKVLLERVERKEDVKENLEKLLEKFFSWEEKNKARIVKSKKGKGPFTEKMHHGLDTLLKSLPPEYKLTAQSEAKEKKSFNRSKP